MCNWISCIKWMRKNVNHMSKSCDHVPLNKLDHFSDLTSVDSPNPSSPTLRSFFFLLPSMCTSLLQLIHHYHHKALLVHVLHHRHFKFLVKLSPQSQLKVDT